MLTFSDHWLDQARHVPSPNHDRRPDPADISLIVVHSISLPPGEFGGPWIDRFFTNCLDPAAHPFFAEVAAMRVSSHFLIDRDGELTQYVPCDRRAWHAGRSCWRDRSECNDFSVGIELEGEDQTPYTASQYRILAQLVHSLRRAYPRIAADAVTGHCDIAPGRKTDPGPAFDWKALEQAMEERHS